MPDDFSDYVVSEPTRTRKGALKYQPADSDWSIDQLPELQDYFSSTYKRALPVTVKGQGSIHNRWGLDHRSSADISLNPSTAEGKAFITELQKRKVPFLAFDRAIPGSSTGPHIHVGRPSSRNAAKYSVGQVKRTSKVSKARPSPTPDDFDKYVITADSTDDFDKYTVDETAATPTKPAISTDLGTFKPVRSLGDIATGKPRPKPAGGPVIDPIAAGVADYETAQRRGIEAAVNEYEGGGVGNLRRVEGQEQRIAADTGVGRLRQLDEPALAQVTRIQKEVADETEQLARSRASGSEAQLLAQRFREGNQSVEVANRIREENTAASRYRELVASLTDEDKRQIADALNYMRGMGSTSRGLETGAQKYGSGMLYKLAGLVDIQPSVLALKMAGNNSPKVLSDYLRRQAGRGEVTVQEIEAELPPDARQQLTDFIAHSITALPEIYGATMLGGPVGGFAALGGLESVGRKQSFAEIAKETAKGAVIGAVFKGAGASEVGGPGRTLAGRTADTARSGAAIGLGTFGVEKAFGADDADALRAAASNIVFHVGMKVPGEVGRVVQAAERVLKTPTPEGGTPTVGPELQTRLESTETLLPETAPIIERTLKTPDTELPSIPPAELTAQPSLTAGPAVDAVAAAPTAPSRTAAYTAEREVKAGSSGEVRRVHHKAFGEIEVRTEGGTVYWRSPLVDASSPYSQFGVASPTLLAGINPPLAERRGPTRMKDADWLELAPAERARVRQEVDIEMAPRRPLTELMAERAETGLIQELGDVEAAPTRKPTAAETFARERVDEMLVKNPLDGPSRYKPNFAAEQAIGELKTRQQQALEKKAEAGDETARYLLEKRQFEDVADLTTRDVDVGPTAPRPLEQVLASARDFNGNPHITIRTLEDSPLKAKVLAALPKDVTLAGPNAEAPEMQFGVIRLRAKNGEIWELDLAYNHRSDASWKKIGSTMDGFAVRKVRKGEAGFLDIGEIVKAVNELRAKFPNRTERELRGMLPPTHRELLEREQPLSTAAQQPRADNGTFIPGAPGGTEAARSQLRSEARKYGEQVKALARHPALREGLDIVNDDVARGYFTRLHRMAAEFNPKQAEAVDRAETLYNQGKYREASMLAQSVFDRLPDKVNEYNAAANAIGDLAKGLEAKKADWSKTWQEVRQRLERTGPVLSGGSIWFDVNKRPDGGMPDHAKIAHVLEPVVEALKADAAWLMAQGKLKTEDYVDHIRKAAVKMTSGEEFADWHPLNRAAALGALVDRLRKDGPPGLPPANLTAEAQPPAQRVRSLPKTLEKSGRDPGTNLTYDRLPNAPEIAKAQRRMQDDGIEALETWYRNAEPSAERTAVFIELVDHYAVKSAELADTAPREAERLRRHGIELDNLEATRSTSIGQAEQMYSQLKRYTPAGALAEIAALKRRGAKVTEEAGTELINAATKHRQLDKEVHQLERKLVAAEAEGGEAPAGSKRPRRYQPRNDTLIDSKSEKVRRQLDEATKRRRAQKAFIDSRLRAMAQQQTVGGYWKRSMNITRGLMVSAFSTAMRNVQTQLLRFDVERAVDVGELALRGGAKYSIDTLNRITGKVFYDTVGLNSDLAYRSILRNAVRQFRPGQTTEAKELLKGHEAEYWRMFNNYAGGVDVAIPTQARTAVERVFQTVEKGVEWANLFNRLQEHHVRSAEFLAELDLHLRKDHNQTLEQFVQRNGIDAIPLKAVEKSVDKALEVTFAGMPTKDGPGGRLLTSLIEVGNILPPTVSPTPFVRFLYNNTKFLYQHSLAGMLDLARKNQNKPRVVSRALVGTSLFLLMWQLRNSDHAGEKWYELKNIGGRDLDTRPFGPFSTYAFLAEQVRRAINGEQLFTVDEIAQALGVSSGPGGSAVELPGKLYDHFADWNAGNESSWNKAMRILKTEAGEFGRALFTPIRQVKDLVAAFDASQAVTRDTSSEPLLGQIRESLPYASTDLPEAHLPTTATPIHQERPATKALSGWRVITPKTFLQRKLDELNFDSREILPSTGIPELDSLQKRLMGPLADELNQELENDAEFKAMSKKAQGAYLRERLIEIREVVRDMGEVEQPELYDKLKEERKPRRQRQFEEEMNSPGLSGALRLGVPMPIPPRRSDEDDIAYRARLLQVGRARRTKLDGAVDFTADRNTQRNRLHAALYS